MWCPPPSPTDNWIRFSSKYVTVVYPAASGARQATRTYYHLIATNKYYVGENWPNVPSSYPGFTLNGLTLGAEFTLANLNNTATWTEKSSQDRNVLAMFQEDGDPSMPTGVHFTGIYPSTKRPTNMGMVQSCLCSVNPQSQGPNDVPFC